MVSLRFACKVTIENRIGREKQYSGKRTKARRNDAIGSINNLCGAIRSEIGANRYNPVIFHEDVTILFNLKAGVHREDRGPFDQDFGVRRHCYCYFGKEAL
jgi:hypothetical protein